MKKKNLLIIYDQISISTGGFWTVFDMAKILEEEFNVDFLIGAFNYRGSLKSLEKLIVKNNMNSRLHYLPFIKKKNNNFLNRFVKKIYGLLLNREPLFKYRKLRSLISSSNKILLGSFITKRSLDFISKNKGDAIIYQNHAGSIETMSSYLESIEFDSKKSNADNYDDYISSTDIVIFQSKSQMTKFNLIQKRKCTEAVSFIPSIDEEKLKNEKNIRPKLFLDGNFNIVYVGTIQNRKRQIFCVELMSELRMKNKKINIFLIGKKIDRNYLSLLEKEISQNGLEKSVHILGYREDYANFMWHSDMIIHTSKDEGVSRVLREALFMNKCILASNIDGSIDLLKEDNAGIILDTNLKNEWVDSILKLINDKNLKHNYENQARMRYHKALALNVYKKNIKDIFV